MRKWFGFAVLLLTISVTAQDSAWHYSTDKDINGKVTEFAISITSDMEAGLCLRCKAGCEPFLKIQYGIVEDQSYVQVKFNDGPVKRFSVRKGDGGDSLFFADPVGLMNAINQNGGYTVATC